MLLGLWRHQHRVLGKSRENSPLRCDNSLRPSRCMLFAMTDVPLSDAFPGHEETLPCSVDPSKIFCKQVCGGALNCSHATCKARCGDCRSLQKVSGSSATHKSHAHGKELACGHHCQGDCESHVKDGFCPPDCSQPCPRACSHGPCRHACNIDCPGCLSDCDTCPLPCSSVSPLLRPCPCSSRLIPPSFFDSRAT